MVAQNGKDLLIKIDMNSAGQFSTVAGLRATRISFNSEAVDVTNLDSSAGWRELLAGAGVKIGQYLRLWRVQRRRLRRPYA